MNIMEGIAIRDGCIRIYRPQSNGRKPVIVGFPGFATTADEYGRIDFILEELSRHGIVGIKFTHSSVRREGNTVVAPFDLADYVCEYAGALEYAAGRDDVDHEHVGVIASSMSGAIVAYLLAKEYGGRKTTAPIRCMAFTAPVTGWSHLYDSERREQLARLKDVKQDWHMDISTPEDKQGNISRKIPGKSIHEFMRLNVLDILKGGITHPGVEILTIGGNADTTVSPTSFTPFHEHFGGRPGNIFIYEGQPHHMDTELYKKKVFDFFTAHLMR